MATVQDFEKRGLNLVAAANKELDGPDYKTFLETLGSEVDARLDALAAGE